MFAATYGLAAALHVRHPLQVVITGAAGDATAKRLEEAAAGVFRYGKALLRVTPEVISSDGLAPALKQTIPHLKAEVAQALVCVDTTCHPPVSNPEELTGLLNEVAAQAAG